MSVEISDIHAGYTSVDILHGISLNARKSEVTVIIGPNGCGKTTLLKTIYGFLKPRRGRVLCNGEDITGLSPDTLLRKKKMAYVLQRRSVFPYLTVYENLKMGGRVIRKNHEELKDAIESIYNMFPILAEKKNVKSGVLSGGEQRMLEIGRALVSHPQVLLLDEPSSGLAPMAVKQVYKKIADLSNKDITIVLVDQNVRLATSLADYVYVIETGRVKFEGKKEDLQIKRIVKSWLPTGNPWTTHDR